MGLYLVWEITVGAGQVAARQAETVAVLERQFAVGAKESGPERVVDRDGEAAFQEGDRIAILRIPRLGVDWAKPVYEGVAPSVLTQGLGHYPQTQLPGQVGNVAMAGHRAGHGNPLIDIDAVREGDAVVVEVEQGWHVYRITGHDIVGPAEVSVLAPVPGRPDQPPTEQSLTLTTCHPRYGSSERWIVHATFVELVARADGPPTVLLAPEEDA